MSERPLISRAELVRPYRHETLRQPWLSIVTDYDGVLGRWVHASLPDHAYQSQFYARLQEYAAQGVGFYVLTNRPAGHMSQVAYNLGVDYGWWGVESGSVLYDIEGHRQMVAPEYVDKLPLINQLRQVLTDHLVPKFPYDFAQPQFEPGGSLVKTVILPPAGATPGQYSQEYLQPLLQATGLDQEFEIKVGKAIDIDPKGLSKSAGLDLVLSQNNLDPKTCVWVGDERRDIPAAVRMAELGGQVAAVGNSHENYLKTIQDLEGITASLDSAYHRSLIQIIDQAIANQEG